jgi:hypothetical protein
MRRSTVQSLSVQLVFTEDRKKVLWHRPLFKGERLPKQIILIMYYIGTFLVILRSNYTSNLGAYHVTFYARN